MVTELTPCYFIVLLTEVSCQSLRQRTNSSNVGCRSSLPIVLAILNQALRRSTISGTRKVVVRFCVEKSRNTSGAGQMEKDREETFRTKNRVENWCCCSTPCLPTTTPVIQGNGRLCEQKILIRSAPGSFLGR